ncbi:hypothetical protein DUI87_06454 [Hirundo rustica rustica]|uniref:Uncharacterized protein n=1 Tax=Hirundo rustica rustica TaxID=333673 RepID=A0A3M0KTB2_HIRRU|nr:hypothetical protein DUI87_06454 [Hirundo rustica rustica]
MRTRCLGACGDAPAPCPPSLPAGNKRTAGQETPQREPLRESKGLITSLYADVQPGHLPPKMPPYRIMCHAQALAAAVPQAGEQMLHSCMAYSTVEPWSDPELASLRLVLASCKAAQISWTPEARAQGTVLAWFAPKLCVYEGEKQAKDRMSPAAFIGKNIIKKYTSPNHGTTTDTELWRLHVVPQRQGRCRTVAEDQALGCLWGGELEGQTRGEHHGAELESWGCDHPDEAGKGLEDPGKDEQEDGVQQYPDEIEPSEKQGVVLVPFECPDLQSAWRQKSRAPEMGFREVGIGMLIATSLGLPLLEEDKIVTKHQRMKLDEYRKDSSPAN